MSATMASSSSNRRAFVIGGDSMIGARLAAVLAQRGETVLATTRRPERAAPDRPLLDLSSDGPEALRSLEPRPGDVAFIAAAVARIAECERAPEAARTVNVDGAERVARLFTEAGGRALFLSTNQVLPDDAPDVPADAALSPRHAYGRQKAEAEAKVLALGGAVLRLAKVFGPSDALVTGWRDNLAAGRFIHPFSDMTAAPISDLLAAEALVALARSGASGIFQLSASRDVTYADLARRLARDMGAPESLIAPISWRSVEIGFAPARFSSMEGQGLLATTGIERPDPFAAVAAVLG
jgi:dTDP-4-dehydrorhamnose reductase